MKISQKFGDMKFNTGLVDIGGDLGKGHCYLGCAAAYDGKYYIMLLSRNVMDLTSGVYTYDIEKGIWHVLAPHDVPIRMLAQTEGIISLCWNEDRPQTRSGGNVGVKSVLEHLESDTLTEHYSSWSAMTGLIGLNTPDMKYMTKVTIRYKGDCTIKIKYDSVGEWETVAELSGGTTSKTFDIIPDRVDHFQLRFEGDGEFYLYSMAKTISMGSDVTYGNI
jgi:hypothetical protein